MDPLRGNAFSVVVHTVYRIFRERYRDKITRRPDCICRPDVIG